MDQIICINKLFRCSDSFIFCILFLTEAFYTAEIRKQLRRERNKSLVMKQFTGNFGSAQRFSTDLQFQIGQTTYLLRHKLNKVLCMSLPLGTVYKCRNTHKCQVHFYGRVFVCVIMRILPSKMSSKCSKRHIYHLNTNICLSSRLLHIFHQTSANSLFFFFFFCIFFWTLKVRDKREQLQLGPQSLSRTFCSVCTSENDDLI